MNKSVTLIELLLAIILLSVVILGVSSIDIFSRNQVISSDRRARIQNQIYLVLEHINKKLTGYTSAADTNVGGAIGNEIPLELKDSVVDIADQIGNNEKSRLKVYIDANANGVKEEPINNPRKDQDHWIAYAFYDNAVADKKYQVQYCGLCFDKTCQTCKESWIPVSENITSFIPKKPVANDPRDNKPFLSDNYVEVEVTACFDPKKAKVSSDCGTLDNPNINMRTRIKLPGVSIQ